MKKIMASILSIVMMCGFFNCIAVNAEEALTQDQLTLLEITGVLEENANWDETVSKAEFAQLISKIAFSLNADIGKQIKGAKITDVSSHHKQYDAISALHGAGYLPIDKFGCFYPDDNITATEAAEIALRVLGYSANQISEKRLIWNKGILDGVSEYQDKISLFSAYKIIYNVLKCDITDLRYIKYFSDVDEMIYINVRLKLYEVKGVVTDDGLSSLYGDTKIDAGEIQINNRNFINSTGRKDLLGLRVNGYCSYNRDQDEAVLLGAYETKNDIVAINSGDIIDFKDRTYYYYTEHNSKEDKIALPTDVVVIYNGKALSLEDDFENSMYRPDNGIVKLCDNDTDGDTDVVFIENYNTYILKLYSENTNSLYFEDGKPLLCLEDKEYVVYDENKKNITAADLKPSNILSVAKSIDGEFYMINVSAYAQEESVASISTNTSGGKTYIKTRSGGKYEISKYALENKQDLELGMSYKFYFDIFDRVVDYKKVVSPDDWQFGYLTDLKFGLDDRFEEVCVVRMYTTNGEFERYLTQNRVRVLDEEDDWHTYKLEELAEAITYRGVIRYRANEDELITQIELPHKAGEKPKKTDRLYYILNTKDSAENGGEAKESYYTKKSGNTVNFGGAAVITEKTVVFTVPDDLKDENKFGFGNASSFKAGQYYALYMFGTDYRSRNAVCADISIGSASQTALSNETPEIIEDVWEGYDEEEEQVAYQIITKTAKGEANTYFMLAEDYHSNVHCIGSGNTNPVELSPGDIAYLDTSYNYIKRAVLAYDASQMVKDEKGNELKGAVAGTKTSVFKQTDTGEYLCSPFSCKAYEAGNKGESTSWQFYNGSFPVRIFVGWVYSYEDGYMIITNQNPKYGFDHDAKRVDGFVTEAQSFTKNVATVVNVGRKGNVKVSAATEAEIKPYNIYGADCSRIVLTQRAYDPRSITIINEN